MSARCGESVWLFVLLAAALLAVCRSASLRLQRVQSEPLLAAGPETETEQLHNLHQCLRQADSAARAEVDSYFQSQVPFFHLFNPSAGPTPAVCRSLLAGKRAGNLDLGLARGLSGALAAKHRMGILQASSPFSPGRRRRAASSLEAEQP